jgi:hypothetical protein
VWGLPLLRVATGRWDSRGVASVERWRGDKSTLAEAMAAATAGAHADAAAEQPSPTVDVLGEDLEQPCREYVVAVYNHCCTVTGVQLKRELLEMLGHGKSRRLRKTVKVRQRLVAALDNLTRQRRLESSDSITETIKQRKAIVQSMISRHVHEESVAQKKRMRTTLYAVIKFFSSPNLDAPAMRSIREPPAELSEVIQRLLQLPDLPAPEGAGIRVEITSHGMPQPDDSSGSATAQPWSPATARARRPFSLLSVAKQGDANVLHAMIKSLRDAGALEDKLNEKDQDGNTAVMEAVSCIKGKKKASAWKAAAADCVRMLLQAGADGWAKNHHNQTAMYKLICNGPDSTEVAGLLLAACPPDEVQMLVEEQPQGVNVAPSCLQFASGGRTPQIQRTLDRCVRGLLWGDLARYRRQINSSTAANADLLPDSDLSATPVATTESDWRSPWDEAIASSSSEDEFGLDDLDDENEYKVVPGGPMGTKLNQHFYSGEPVEGEFWTTHDMTTKPVSVAMTPGYDMKEDLTGGQDSSAVKQVRWNRMYVFIRAQLP